MGYIGKHWRGELSLFTAFWISFLFFSIVFAYSWIPITFFVAYHPITYARLDFSLNFFAIFILYPWQMVGLWKTCERGQDGVRTYWGRTVQILVVLSIFGFIGRIAEFQRDSTISWHIGFEYKEDGFQNYTVKLAENNPLIHIKGALGFGVSDKFIEILDKHSEVKGVILDSNGGRIFEGRELARIIVRRGLDTYSLKGCSSACTNAFIVGKNRYLSSEAKLGFHQYGFIGPISEFLKEELKEELLEEQKRDLAFFRQSGIKEKFIERMFIASNDDFWHPTVNEMLEANVIHGTLKSSDIIPRASERNSPFPNIENMTGEEILSEIMGSFEKKLEDGDRDKPDRKKAFIESQRIRFQPLLNLLEELVASFGREYIETKIWDSGEVNGYRVEGYYIAVGNYPFDLLEEYAIEPGFFFKNNIKEALPVEKGFIVTKFETDYNSGSQEHEFQEKTLFNSGTQIHEFQTKEEVIKYLAEEIPKPIAILRNARKNDGKKG
jgi:hypothetical protein